MINYSNFNELQAVYNFDMKLKTMLYPQIMFLETVFKNYALEITLDEAKSEKFVDIYTNLMVDYKSYEIASSMYKKAMKTRLNVREQIYKAISKNYDKNRIVNHYYNKSIDLPIWAIFELISFGEIGYYIKCLKPTVRQKISNSIGIKKSFDSDGKLFEKIIFALKDLRNAVAHNNPIFDTRFKKSEIDKRLSKYLVSELKIKNYKFNFKEITDYVILIGFMLKLVGCTKKEINAYIRQFEDSCDMLYKAVPFSIYSQIIPTTLKQKIIDLKKIFIKLLTKINFLDTIY